MKQKLEIIGFTNLKDFLLNLNIDTSNTISNTIYIKLNKDIPPYDLINRISLNEIIEFSIKRSIIENIQNILSKGYKLQNNKLVSYFPNTIVYELLNDCYNNLLLQVGDSLFIFFLVYCTMIREVEGNYHVISGSLNNRIIRNICISRNRLFFKDGSIPSLNWEDIYNFITDIGEEVIGEDGGCKLDRIKVSKDIENARLDNSIVENNLLDLNNILSDLNNLKTSLRKVNQRYTKKFINQTFYRICISDKPQDFDFISPLDPLKLIKFLFDISKKLLSPLFLKYNLRILKQKLVLLVYKNKYETFSIEEVIRYFRVNDLFKNRNNISKDRYILRQKIFNNLIFYLFEYFYIPLISSLIYSTEGSFTKNKVLYFIRYKWYQFSDRFIQKYINNNLINNNLINNTNILAMNIRVIPKGHILYTGRVITNLNKLDNINIPNRSLRGEYNILKVENRNKLGCSVLGYEDMICRIYKYLNKTNVFILKVDIKKCFDNINHKYLEKILDKLFEEEEYIVKICDEIEILYFNTNTILYQIKTKRKYHVSNQYLPYYEYFPHKECLIQDNSYTKAYKRDEMIKRIKTVLLENRICYKNTNYKQKQGIPQGSILSTLICSIYYKYIDKKYLNKIFKEGMMVRYIDDFLVLSTSKKEVVQFTKILNKLEQYGISVNEEKVEKNYISDEKNNITFKENSIVKYCGLLIKTRKMKEDHFVFIRKDISDRNMVYGISSSSTNLGLSIYNKMMMYTNKSLIVINRRNLRVYKCIYDLLVLFVWRIRILFRRAIFCNKKFYKQIVDVCVTRILEECIHKGVYMTREKLECMLETIEKQYPNK